MTGTSSTASSTGPESVSLPVPRDAIAGLPRYSSAASASVVTWRASSNESAVVPSPAVVEAIRLAAERVHIYPTMGARDLTADLALRLGVDPEQIVAGGGSIAVIQQAILAYAGPGDEVVYAWRSYEAYPILIGVAGATAVSVPLNKNGGHDLDAMADAITERTTIVIVCSPNNPTGVEVGHAELIRFLERVPPHVLVILDEAYWEFREVRENDGIEIAKRFPNVATFRTFSKAHALAGARVGYMVAHSTISEFVRLSSVPFGVNSLAEAAARAAVSDDDHIAAIAATVAVGRRRMTEALNSLGIQTFESGGNFVWANVGDDAKPLERACNAEGVSVRAFAGEGLRVTVGDRDAEDAVIRAFEKFARMSHVESA